jgi:hypothetical protein
LRRWRFRFTTEADQKQYGDGWYVWDEAKIAHLPAHELATLEAEIGTALVRVFEGARRDLVAGNLPATWLAIRAVDPDIAGPYAKYAPLIMFVEWDSVPADEAPESDLDPLEPTTSTDSQDAPSTE